MLIILLLLDNECPLDCLYSSEDIVLRIPPYGMRNPGNPGGKAGEPGRGGFNIIICPPNVTDGPRQVVQDELLSLDSIQAHGCPP